MTTVKRRPAAPPEHEPEALIEEARARQRRRHRGVAGRGYPLGLFNQGDYVRIGGEELAMLADQVIGAAERACAAGSRTGETGLQGRSVVRRPGPAQQISE